jgi:hypothetical protein
LVPDLGSRSTLVAAIEELVAAIEAHREPESSGRDGKAALELALACHASEQAGGTRVALPLANRELRVVSR